MAVVTYEAKRSILDSHTAEFEYDLDLCLLSADPTNAVFRSDQQALSGRRETLFWNQRKGFTVSIGPYTEVSEENDEVIEFLDSTIGGEAFIFDMWGSAGSPNNPLAAVMTEPYSADRFVRRPGPATDKLRYTFTFEFISSAS